MRIPHSERHHCVGGAGSVVLPLHHPIRVAEEWAVVDNLSQGRVDLSFATGWNPNDFVLSPERYEKRVEVTYAGIESVQKLWRGESISQPNGIQQAHELRNEVNHEQDRHGKPS